MRVEKKSGADERRILIGMITDSHVLAMISEHWNVQGLFRSEWANLVGQWCIDHFRQYGVPPKSAIEDRFRSWSVSGGDKEVSLLISRLLEVISNEYEGQDVNAEYLIDLAGKHFNKIRLETLKERIQDRLDEGDVDGAENLIVDWNRVEIGAGSGVDIFNDQEVIKEAFQSKGASLIDYPGPLQKFLSPALERDALIAFMGPEKSGKTWMLIDLAWRAVAQRRKVAFFEVGDMSQNQVVRRFVTRAAKRPIYSGKVRIPKEFSRDDDGVRIEFEEKEYDSPLDWKAGWESIQRFMKQKVKSDEPPMKLSCHPNNTISVNGVESIIRSWERRGWVPDVVVIDYADILAPISKGKDGREQVNETWKALRALSQSLHCLVVTATQANAESYFATTLRRSNFSEDHRKLAHVTGLVGMSAREEEKADGIMRLNWIVLREGEYSESRCMYTARCLAIGNPIVKCSS